MRHTPEHGTCERCPRLTDLRYVESVDEYLCEDCEQNLAEAAYERHQQDLMENGPGPSLLEQQAEARKLK